jgi:hypothetical protein
MENILLITFMIQFLVPNKFDHLLILNVMHATKFPFLAPNQLSPPKITELVTPHLKRVSTK